MYNDRIPTGLRWIGMGTLVLLGTLCLPHVIQAQDRRDFDHDRDRDQARLTRIEPGAIIQVRTNETINSRRRDDRVYTGMVNEDVYGENGQVAFPRGSPVELTVRVARDNDLILDLESVTAYGQRYAIDANTERIESREGIGENRRTGEYVGGGAALGAIIGAIAGGGKGAAIGAAAGAGAGAGTQILTRGRVVKVPQESLLTFRLERPLVVGVPDRGYSRGGHHYHDHDYPEGGRR